MPSKDKMYNGRKGIGFENPSYFGKVKDLRPTLYDERIINLGYTLMFLKHSDEALEIEKFKKTRENKIEFAYDYGNLNASYVNEKINLSAEEIINPDFDKIDSPFQQKSSLKLIFGHVWTIVVNRSVPMVSLLLLLFQDEIESWEKMVDVLIQFGVWERNVLWVAVEESVGDLPLHRFFFTRTSQIKSRRGMLLLFQVCFIGLFPSVIEADDQAIQTILLGLPEDIYAAVDSCETTQEIWLRVQLMMKGSDIGIQEKKAKLFNKWESQNGVDMLPLFIRPRTCTQLITLNSPHQDQSSFNQNYLQQPMPNPKDITDPTTAMNMALSLMAKAFKLNYSTPTNNNQRISSNPCNRQIAQPCMNMGQDRQMQMNIGNQIIQNVVQNPRVQNIGNQNGLIGDQRNGNQNQIGNGNLVATRAEGNAAGQNGNQIRCYNCKGVGHYARNCMVRPRRRDVAYLQTQLLIAQKEEAGIQLQAKEYDLMAAAADLDEIKEVNANCILMANLQQASTSSTQTDKAPIYDSDGSAEYTELLEPIPESHQVPQNNNDVVSQVTRVEQSGEIVEQHPVNFEETRALYDSLYQNLAIEVEKINSVNRNIVTNSRMTPSWKEIVSLTVLVKLASYTLGTLSSVRRPKPSGVMWMRKWSSNTVKADCPVYLWIIDSGCSKHMTGNRTLLTNFMEKFLGTVRFGNNYFAMIAGYGDVVIGSMTIKKVYYVEGLGHNLFSVGQFCDKGLEVAFRKSTCFVRTEDGVDLLTSDRLSKLYTIALNKVTSNSSACLLAKASSSQSWLWHQCLSHLNFATINNLVKNNFVQGLPKMKFKNDHLCSACEQGKIYRNTTSPNGFCIKSATLSSSHGFVWSDKTQVNLLLQVQRVRTDNGIEFKNKTLAKFFDEVDITQQFSAARTPQQNDVVERRNQTLVEAARTMLTFANLPLCYLLNDYDDVGKLKAKEDVGVFVRYSKEFAAFRIYNKRTCKIHESVNVNFDEISEMASKQFSLEPGLSNLNEMGKSSNPTVSQVSETSKKDLKDLF
nr:integrase, catalytic region, zinc finger, CCHC-type, peptidase aspartic, catalytic [Tanacetum cinerariifolium]